MKTSILTVGIILLLGFILYKIISNSKKRARKQALDRIFWIIGQLKLPFNEYADQYFYEAQHLILKHDIQPHQVDLDTFKELNTIAEKCFSSHYLLKLDEYRHLKTNFESVLLGSTECPVQELSLLTRVYIHAQVDLKKICSRLDFLKRSGLSYLHVD